MSAPPPDSDPDDRLDAVQKVCAVLRALTEHSPAALRDIAQTAELNKVTALRILGTLVTEGFVQRPVGGKTYALGPQAVAMSLAFRRSSDVLALARPALTEIALVSGDSVVLSLRAGAEAICVDRQTGDFPIQSNYLFLGTRRPLGIGAGATAILATLPEREIESLLLLLQPQLSRFPRLTLNLVRQQVAQTRRAGYCVVLNSIVDRMGGLGVPIRSPQGDAVASISVVALSERIETRLSLFAELLGAKAAEVERLIGTP